MKWQIVYLIVVLVSLNSIVVPTEEMTGWSGVIGAYGALPECVTGWQRSSRRSPARPRANCLRTRWFLDYCRASGVGCMRLLGGPVWLQTSSALFQQYKCEVHYRD